LIKRFVEDVILVFDSDEAGRKASVAAANILFESGLNVKILPLPDKEDPDSFLRKNGGEAFQELVASPLSIIDFYMRLKGDRRSIAHEAIQTIFRISDRVLQGHYVKMLSEKLRINEFFIIEELKKLQKSNKSRETKAASKSPSGPKSLDEIYILKLLLQLPERVAEITDIFAGEDFKHSAVRSIFNKIKSGLTDFNELLLRSEGDEKDFLTEVSMREDIENPDKALEDCVTRMKGNKRKVLLQELQGKIREAEAKKDFNLLKALQEEQLKLQRGK